MQRGVLSQIYSRTHQYVKAVDDVTFEIRKGDVFGLVGESGSGKTTTGKMTAALLKPTDGQVLIDGTDLYSLDRSKLRAFRRKFQFIFQDPLSSLNPKMTIGETIAEPLRYLSQMTRAERKVATLEVLERVGLSPASTFYDRYPHHVSGGQRQRVVIARAISIGPEYLVADEPVAMVDVSVRAQIMDLLLRMQKEMNLTILLITHDLAVAKFMCNRIAVMYLGKIMESSTKGELFKHPLHPYTQALLQAVPNPDPKERSEKKIPHGEIPSAIDPPAGCRFHPRCPFVFDRCKIEVPELLNIDGNHTVACHLYFPKPKV